ncbi:MAG: hypothetical protein JXX29_14230 [Deltaproteobacteria bacterium]|nr:hypothetical protein [Deltaproteobacteria bacterium]MBN2672836.1 hypothetical protein [Deltaproteobacteria bacterium]
MKPGFWITLFMVQLLCTWTFAFDEAAFIAGTEDESDEDAETETGEESSVVEETVSAETNADGIAISDAISGLQFHGRFEDQFTLMVMKDSANRTQKHLYNYLQLRLDMDADLPGNIVLRSDGVIRLFAGDTSVSMGEIIPPGTAAQATLADPRLAAVLQDDYSFEDRAYLDNAYVKIPVGAFGVTLGKQPLGQGAGYVWNPTDLFTQKEMLDPSYQQEGVISVKLTVPMGRAFMELITAPDNGFHYWTSGGRLQFPLGSFQFSAVGYYARAQFIDMEQSMDAVEAAMIAGASLEDAVVVENHKRLLFGGDMVVDIEGVRLWTEAAYNYLPSKADWLEVEGGLEYFFPFETHFLFEYFYYGRAPVSHGGSYSLNGWVNVLDGNFKMLGRHFVFESIEHPIADYWSLGVSSFQGFSDGSAIVEADLKWDFLQDAQLWLMAATGIGGREDFLTNSFQSWLRLTVFY